MWCIPVHGFSGSPFNSVWFAGECPSPLLSATVWGFTNFCAEPSMLRRNYASNAFTCCYSLFSPHALFYVRQRGGCHMCVVTCSCCVLPSWSCHICL